MMCRTAPHLSYGPDSSKKRMLRRKNKYIYIYIYISAAPEHRSPNANKCSARAGFRTQQVFSRTRTRTPEQPTPEHEHEHNTNTRSGTDSEHTFSTPGPAVGTTFWASRPPASSPAGKPGQPATRTTNKTQHLTRTPNITEHHPNTEHRTRPNIQPNTFRFRTSNATPNTNTRFPNTEHRYSAALVSIPPCLFITILDGIRWQSQTQNYVSYTQDRGTETETADHVPE